MTNDKTDTDAFCLSDSPGHLLHCAQQFAADRFSNSMAATKLTQRQFAVLSATASQEGLTQTDLVKRTGIDRSTLAELIVRMVRNGLLTREKMANDARANSIFLSARGRALIEAATLGAMEADSAILAALPKAKRASFLKTLRRIAQTLEQGDAGAKKTNKGKQPDHQTLPDLQRPQEQSTPPEAGLI